MSATTLNRPGMCCEYKAALSSINRDANHRAMLLCTGFEDGKEALCNHPNALELSVSDKGFAGVLAREVVMEMVMAAARNSRVLIESLPIMSGGSWKRQAPPFML